MAKGLIFLVSAILLLSIYVSADSITTESIYPSSAYICGPYPNNVTITALGVYNNESSNITGITAVLIMPSPSALSLLTNQSVSLGNLSPGTKSSANPSWTVKCDDATIGSYAVYVNYTSTNGFNG